jgi:uncharacterized small protein (DUF1192 family)
MSNQNQLQPDVNDIIQNLGAKIGELSTQNAILQAQVKRLNEELEKKVEEK